MPDGPDHHLRQQVREVQSLVVQVGQNLDRVGNEVMAVGAAQQQTINDLAQLRADFLAYTQTAERRANVQRAEIKLGNLADELDHTFGHHKVVRRTATGLLQAFDTGLVSEDTVRSVSEQLMIQTPRYWLAPALVALSAWSADDPDLCERAVAEAYRRSPGKTTLLFTLVLRRQQRIDSSCRWLVHHLQAQDPRALGRDFAVILEAVAQGAFGPAGRAAVEETLASWAEALSDDAAHTAQVERWQAEVESYRPGVATGDFPALSSISPEWQQLGTALSGAEGHEPLLERYRALMAEEVTTSSRIEDAMDDILDRLVTEYDNDELPIRQELAYNQAVVDRDGDLAAAKADAARGSAAFEETLDYLTIQTVSALDPGTIGVSRATQKIAVAQCRPWFEKAHAQATDGYQRQLPGDVGVTLGKNHNIGSTTFQLPDWSGKLSAGLPVLEQSLSGHWDDHTRRFIESLAFSNKKIIVPAIVTLLVLIFSIAINPAFGILVTLLVGGIWGFRLYRQYEQSQKQQEQARKLLADWKQESITQLRAASAELTDWSTRYGRAHARADDVTAFIAQLQFAGQAGTPFERRTLQTGAQA